ncbi:hypothetical protein BDR26DRAFT_859611 [Obelidium mucronatum]|nr:hypothetical protein BDR26DRAFT_859611 [Obelidium mucronatum]
MESIPYEVYVATALGVGASIALIALIYFIFKVQLIQLNKKVTIKNVFTPFNKYLTMMACSQLLLTWAEVGLLMPRISDQVLNTSVAYLRAEHILDDIIPNTNPYISFFLKHVKYLFIVNVLTRFIVPDVAFHLNKASIYISIFNGVLVLGVDLVCLYAFVTFLRQTKESDDDETDKQFRIISIYGITFFYYSFWDCLCIMCSTATFLVLFKMKVELHREKMERMNARLTVVNLHRPKDHV